MAGEFRLAPFGSPLTIAILLATGLAGYVMGLQRIWGHAQVSFHHARQSATLKKKDGSTLSLLEFVKSVTPPCRLNALLFNGHLQTMWTVLKSEDVPIYYKRKVFDGEDPAYPGTFAVDFVTDPYDAKDKSLPPRTTFFSQQEFREYGSLDTRPMLVALHGLSGGSHEVYLRHCLAPIVGKFGWEAVVVNSRGCAGSKITSPILYNARATWDVRQTVKWLRKTFPNRPLFGIGFSLGANILTNYLGEEGARCQLKAAVICSNPWNLEAGSLSLQRRWLGLHVYSRAMGTNMKKLVKTHIEQISTDSVIDVGEVMKLNFLHEFDRQVQCPTWGYPTEGAYYRDASSCDSLLAIRIPFLGINAEDDPIAVNEAIPYQEMTQTQFGVLVTTSLGGHLSWFEPGGGRWFARAATNFLLKLHAEINLDDPSNLASATPEPQERSPLKPKFDPMRRKMSKDGMQ